MKIRGKRLQRIEILGIAIFASALALTTARAIGIEDIVDGGNTYAWQEVALLVTGFSAGGVASHAG